MSPHWSYLGDTSLVSPPLVLLAYVTSALIACALIIGWLDPAFATDPVAASSGAILANAIPPVLIALLLLGLTRRPLLSLWIVLVALYALYTANALKLAILDTPLLPADFVLLTHLGDGGGLLARYLPRVEIVKLAAALAIALLLTRERAVRSLQGLSRGLLVVAVLGLGATLAMNTPPWSQIYAADAAGFMTWSPADVARHSGLPTALLCYAWSTTSALPQPDRAAARRIMQQHALAPAAAAQDLPDIVVLQSESFFDPARLRGLEADQMLPEFRRLAATSQHGNLWVPTYGGGTIRTEFEVLTGLAMRYFPAVQYPYFGLTSAPVRGIPSVLAAHGYRTIAVHPHDRGFWNRASAFAHLGFQEFDGIEQFHNAARSGYYISDEALIEHVLKRLDAATAPTFVFAISMENHGPYDHYPNVDEQRRAAEPVPPGLSGDSAAELRGYLYHLENADRALGRLADALRARPRRSLLLFYGDHLPALPEIYHQAGFDDADEATVEPVPWLLLDTARPQTTADIDTAAFYLPALLLDTAGIDDTWFRLLDAVRRDDRPGPNWTPVEDDGLRAITLLRQRGEFRSMH